MDIVVKTCKYTDNLMKYIIKFLHVNFECKFINLDFASVS